MYAHLCTRLGDCAEIVDQVRLGHANASIAEDEQLILLVGGDANVKVLSRLEGGWVCERGIADFVEGVGAVGNEFTKEDFFVAVECVFIPD